MADIKFLKIYLFFTNVHYICMFIENEHRVSMNKEL